MKGLDYNYVTVHDLQKIKKTNILINNIPANSTKK